MSVFVSRMDSYWKCSPFNPFAGEPHKQTVAPEGCILRGTVFIDGITSSVQVGVRGQIEKQVPRQLRGNVVSSVLSTFSIHHTYYITSGRRATREPLDQITSIHTSMAHGDRTLISSERWQVQ